MTTLDLQDAYFHLPILARHRKFLRFRVAGQDFQFRVLPVGLRSAPRVFTKVVTPVAAYVRLQGIQIYPLDDCLFKAQSFDQPSRRSVLQVPGPYVQHGQVSISSHSKQTILGSNTRHQTGKGLCVRGQTPTTLLLGNSHSVKKVHFCRTEVFPRDVIFLHFPKCRNAASKMRPV